MTDLRTNSTGTGLVALGGVAIAVAVAGFVLAVFPGLSHIKFGGFEPIDRWAISVLAVALLVLGLSVRRGAGSFGLLAFVFLTGGGAQLYLTDPLWFPTLRLKPEDPHDAIMMIVLGLEAVVALVMLRRVGIGRMIAEAGTRLGWDRIAIFLGLSTLLCSPILNYIWLGAAKSWLLHIVAGGAILGLHLSVLAAMGRVKSPATGMYRLTPIAPAGILFVASLALGFFAFEHLPHVEDEVAYLFQAKGFSQGALSFPAPPDAAVPGLEYYLLEVRDGRWFSTSVPGWPVALTPFVALGLPWLLNPILAAISVLLAYDIALRKIGRDQADFVALAMGLSPWMIAAAASLMPHMLTLTLMLFGWWMILRSRPSAGKEKRRLILAGLAMGWIFATRPLDGLIIGGLTGIWVLTGPAGTTRRFLLFAAGCVASGSLLLIHNYALTGSPMTLALTQYLDQHWGAGANAFGFGPNIAPPGGWRMLDLWNGHSPAEALLNIINMLANLQFEMLGWPIGSLALIYAFFLWQGRKLAFDWVMLALVVAVIAILSLYWFADSYYIGPRYWFLAAFPLFYLAARGYDGLRHRFAEGRDGESAWRFDAILSVCFLFGLLVFTPWRGVTKYYEYGRFHTLYRDAAESGQFGNAIVILAKSGDQGTAFMLNDPFLSGPGPIFLHDTGTLDEAALRAAFPGREIIHYDAKWPKWVPPSLRAPGEG